MFSSLRGARNTLRASSSSSGSQQQLRYSHIGSAALFVPPTTKLTTLAFAPVSNPTRRQPTALQKAKSIQVQGPKGTVLVPLPDYVQLNWDDQSESSTLSEPRKLQLTVKDSTVKTQRSTWGLTRALLFNAIEGVEEGHTSLLRLVGVGYRATIETDPFPRPDKFEVALASTPSTFETKEQQSYYAKWTAEQAQEVGPEKKRLTLRLGYSHPIYLPIPRGITCSTPAPTRIVIKGTDKEQVGLFASQIRRWRKPEPYKGKGVFVNGETIKLKTPKKK
ncbi:hypothetical protein CBS101457_000614 [Exobasidium rhododendri]|nr:hypothetical protein CBS101457_000614 [Exobasidium rhododendri]